MRWPEENMRDVPDPENQISVRNIIIESSLSIIFNSSEGGLPKETQATDFVFLSIPPILIAFEICLWNVRYSKTSVDLSLDKL